MLVKGGDRATGQQGNRAKDSVAQWLGYLACLSIPWLHMDRAIAEADMTPAAAA